MRDPILGKLIIRPGRAMRDIIAEKPLTSGLVVFLLGVVSVAAAFFLEAPPPAETSPGATAALILAAVLAAGLLKVFYWTGAVHLTADLLGGAGRGLALLVCVLHTAFPAILAAPLVWLARMIPSPWATLVLAVGGVLLCLWVVVLQLTAIREVYRFTWGRALSTWLPPVLVPLILAIGPALAALPAITSLLGQP